MMIADFVKWNIDGSISFSSWGNTRDDSGDI